MRSNGDIGEFDVVDRPTLPAFIEALRQGDDAAWQKMNEAYLPWLTRLIAGHSGPPITREDIEEIVQDSAIKVRKHFAEAFVHKGPGSFRGFLARTGRSCQIDCVRRRTALKRSGQGIDESADVADLADPDWADDQLIRGWHARDVLQFGLEKLRERIGAEATELYVVQRDEELTYEQLADMFPAMNVKTMLEKARRAAREIREEYQERFSM